MHGDFCKCYDDLTAELDKYKAALEKIVNLESEKDSKSGFNEWGEAECFHNSQFIAKSALAQKQEKK